MQIYNIITVISPDCSKTLVCLRSKEPYKGLYNFVGGKAEPGEDSMSAAYRELYEETGITNKDITLTHLMDFVYPLSDCMVGAYAGRLIRETELREEAHSLHWHGLEQDFFDMNVYAGEGNMGHLLEELKIHWETVIKKTALPPDSV